MAVHVDRSLIEEGVLLPGPHVESRFVNSVLKAADVGGGKATAEITGRRRIGNAFGAQRVEKRFIVSPQFNIFQRTSFAERIVSNVEHMIRLTIGKIQFQQMKPPVDSIDESRLPSQHVHQSDASVVDRLGSFSDFVLDVRSGENGTRIPVDKPIASQSLFDTPLALLDNLW